MENVLLFLFILSPVIMIFGVLKLHKLNWHEACEAEEGILSTEYALGLVDMSGFPINSKH